jgi:transposase
LEKRRLEAIRLFQAGELNLSEIGRQLKVVPQTVSRWRKEYQLGGVAAMKKAGRAGRKPQLTRAQLEQLVQVLLQGPEKFGYESPLWTSVRVGHVIEELFGIEFHKGHVWRILRQLGWSPQRPVGRALERNEQAIEEWKWKQWPAIKKKPKKNAAPSS